MTPSVSASVSGARGTGIGNVQTNYLIPPHSKQKLEDVSSGHSGRRELMSPD
jgi:hypothetical protein